MKTAAKRTNLRCLLHMVALNISFHSSHQNTLNLKLKKKKHGGRVSIQAAESDLHSQDGPRAAEQQVLSTYFMAMLRQKTKDAQIYQELNRPNPQICSLTKIIVVKTEFIVRVG